MEEGYEHVPQPCPPIPDAEWEETLKGVPEGRDVWPMPGATPPWVDVEVNDPDFMIQEMPDKVPGRHRWVAEVVFSIKDEQARMANEGIPGVQIEMSQIVYLAMAATTAASPTPPPTQSLARDEEG